jgi:hypothetical protein
LLPSTNGNHSSNTSSDNYDDVSGATIDDVATKNTVLPAAPLPTGGQQLHSEISGTNTVVPFKLVLIPAMLMVISGIIDSMLPSFPSISFCLLILNHIAYLSELISNSDCLANDLCQRLPDGPYTESVVSATYYVILL